MAQFADYISCGLCNLRLIFPRMNGPNGAVATPLKQESSNLPLCSHLRGDSSHWLWRGLPHCWLFSSCPYTGGEKEDWRRGSEVPGTEKKRSNRESKDTAVLPNRQGEDFPCEYTTTVALYHNNVLPLLILLQSFKYILKIVTFP